jgi:hypothetical protein
VCLNHCISSAPLHFCTSAPLHLCTGSAPPLLNFSTCTCSALPPQHLCRNSAPAQHHRHNHLHFITMTAEPLHDPLSISAQLCTPLHCCTPMQTSAPPLHYLTLDHLTMHHLCTTSEPFNSAQPLDLLCTSPAHLLLTTPCTSAAAAADAQSPLLNLSSTYSAPQPLHFCTSPLLHLCTSALLHLTTHSAPHLCTLQPTQHINITSAAQNPRAYTVLLPLFTSACLHHLCTSSPLLNLCT